MILIIGGCGYIGSALHKSLIEKGYQCDAVDLEWYGNPGRQKNTQMDYRSLSAMDLAQYSYIVFLAAHSSVKMALADPAAAFYNNVLGFKQLLEKITPNQRLIYASSASVYNGVAGSAVDEEWPSFTLGNMYDFSKYSNDCFSRYSGCNYISLRFGTVNGVSPNMRTDLIINRMVLTAMRDGVVNIINPKVHRPILGLMDLTRVIESMIRENPPIGIYNVASFNSTVQRIGEYISNRLGVDIIRLPDTPTYDFSVRTDKLSNVLKFEFSETLEALVDQLALYYKTTGFIGHER